MGVLLPLLNFGLDLDHGPFESETYGLNRLLGYFVVFFVLDPLQVLLVAVLLRDRIHEVFYVARVLVRAVLALRLEQVREVLELEHFVAEGDAHDVLLYALEEAYDLGAVASHVSDSLSAGSVGARWRGRSGRVRPLGRGGRATRGARLG